MISPIESACILNSPLPSPLNIDADTDPVINVFALIVSVSDAGVSIIDVSILEAEKAERAKNSNGKKGRPKKH